MCAFRKENKCFSGVLKACNEVACVPTNSCMLYSFPFNIINPLPLQQKTSSKQNNLS